MLTERGAVPVAATVCVMLSIAAGCLHAADYLRPEWQVGQERIAPQDLQVVVPPVAPEKVSLQDAVQLALKQNAGFRRSIQGLLAARSNWYVARQRWALEAFG